MRKSIRVIQLILITLILLITALIVTVSFMSFISKKPVSILGYSYGVVETHSMEPMILVGDFVLIQDVDYTTLEVNDVIAFKSVYGITIVHQIISKHDEGFITKGINNPEDDFATEGYITADEYIGKVTQFGGNFIGKFIVDSRLVFIGIIIIICLVLFIIQGYNILKQLFMKQKLKYEKDLADYKKELLESLEKERKD